MKKIHVLLFSMICLLIFFSGELFGQTGSEETEIRTALVIGNSNYRMGVLSNPVNDARAMATVLKQVGFDVILKTEIPNKDEMKRAIREFGRKLENGGIGLFYYAGHGLQVDGINYLIPVNAQIYNQEEVEYECVEAGFLLAQMENARNTMNVVIIDACRDNPFARSFRSSNRGLATINAPTGTLIAYATAPGSVASDGTGKNGLYTEILLNEIQVEGQKIEETFKNVRRAVLDMSDGRQTPWESSSLIGDFYFVPPIVETVPVAQVNNEPVQNIRAEQPEMIKNEVGDAEITWKADNLGQYVFRNNRPVSDDIQVALAGHDAVVFDKTTKRTWILQNSTNLKDNQIRAAEPVNYRGEIFWRRDGEGFFLFDKGIPIHNETVSDWFGDHLWVVHEKAGRGYLLKDFNKTPATEYRPANIVRISSPLMWGKISSEIYMFENGKRLLTEANKNPVNKDILVYSSLSGDSYLLGGYTTVAEGNLQPAENLDKESDAFWKGNRDGYWFYVMGVEVTNDTEYEEADKDLKVMYGENTYLLKNYWNLLDTKLRVATPLNVKAAETAVSRTQEVAKIKDEATEVKAEWKANKDYYWFYLDGKEVSDETEWKWASNEKDMIVTHKSTGKKYLFRNYLESRDNKTRVAEEMK
jgi:hypothetical protein